MQAYDFLFVAEDKETLKQLEEIARSNRWTCQIMNSGPKTLEALVQSRFKALVIDNDLPGVNGLQILEWLKTHPASPEVVLLVSQGSVETAVKALKLGAFDCLTKPLDAAQKATFCLSQALEKNRLRADHLNQETQRKIGEFHGIIGASPKIQAVFEMIRNVANSDSNVLIQGESGTGKELVAKAIHELGPRKTKPFVVINCAAMPETLLESELFGFKKGSFTGANTDKQGLFEIASGGTVFLDEIGEVPTSIQVKLLRVLQEGEIRRIGDSNPLHVDVRIMAATNRDLVQMIAQGEFREDLFYRLHVINIHLPPLRERADDVMLLARHFLEKIGKKIGKEINRISVDALQALQNYSWPGNVRELENIIERSMVLCDGDTITAKSLPPKILSNSFYNVSIPEDDYSQLSYKQAKKRALNIFNRSYIMGLLEKTGGNITAASEKAGMDRSNFKKIIRKYGVDSKVR